MVTQWSVLLACFFLSWQLVRLPALNFTLSDGFFVAALVAILLAGRLNAQFFGRLTGLWMMGLLLLLGGLFCASVIHDQTVRWFVIAAQYLLALLMVPLVLASLDREVLGKASLAFAYGVASSQVVGIVALKWIGYDALTPVVGRTIVLGNDRIGALTAEPNANGAVCVFALIIVVAALIERRMRPIIGAICAAAIIVGLVFSASFTALLAVVASICTIALMTWSNGFKRIGIPIILLAVAYIGLGGPLPDVFNQRVAQAVFEMELDKAGTFGGRMVLIKEAWALADHNLVIGMGVDQYREASVHGAPVHNLALLLLNEGGLPALIGLVTAVLCLLATSIMVGYGDRIGGAVCFAALAVLLIYTMSLPHMYARHWFGPVALVFAYYMAPRLRVMLTPTRPSSRQSVMPEFRFGKSAGRGWGSE